MPYKSVLIERVHVLRWGVAVLASDISPIVKEVEDARQRTGQQIIGIVLVPPDFSPPDGEMRKALGQNLRRLMNCNESIHYVVEGNGFKSSIMRSVLTNILMLTGQRGKITVATTLDESLAQLEPRLKEICVTKNQIISLVKAKGMYAVELVPPPPKSPSRPPRFFAR